MAKIYIYKVFTTSDNKKGIVQGYYYGRTQKEAKEEALKAKEYWKSLGWTKVMIRKA